MAKLDIAAPGDACTDRWSGSWIVSVVCVSAEGRRTFPLEHGLRGRGLPQRMAGSAGFIRDDLRNRERAGRGHGNFSPQRIRRRSLRIGDSWTAQGNSLESACRVRHTIGILVEGGELGGRNVSVSEKHFRGSAIALLSQEGSATQQGRARGGSAVRR